MLFLVWFILGTCFFIGSVVPFYKSVCNLCYLVREYGWDKDYVSEAALHVVGVILLLLLLLPWGMFLWGDRHVVSSEAIRVEYVESASCHMMWRPTDSGYRLESYEKLFGQVYDGRSLLLETYTYEWLFFELPPMSTIVSNGEVIEWLLSGY
jgi:hypothetical protein